MKKITLLLMLFIMSIIWGKAQTVDKLPYSDGFETWENSNANPVGWTVINKSSKWQRISSSGSWIATTYYSRSGYAAYIPSSEDGALEDWLISPKIKVPSADFVPTLNFWYGAATSGLNAGEFDLMVSTTGTELSDFQKVGDSYTVEPATTPSGRNTYYSYTEKSLSLANYAGQEIYIAIKATSAEAAAGILIDDFSILVGGDKLPIISDLTVSEAESNYITVKWKSEKVGTHYLTISGRTDTIKVISTEGITEYSWKFSGLASATPYTVKLWANASASENIITSSLSTNTQTKCGTTTDAQGADYFWKSDLATSAGRLCFDTINGGSSLGWGYNNDSYGHGHVYRYQNYGDAHVSDDWLLTPAMLVPDQSALIIKLWGQTNNSYPSSRFSVWFVPEGAPVSRTGEAYEAAGTCLLPTREVWGTVAQGDSLIIDLAPYNLQNREGRFAIRMEGNGYYSYLHVGEFRIQQTPNCRPPVVVNVIDIEETSAKLEIPTGTSSGSSFNVKYVPDTDLESPTAEGSHIKIGSFIAGQQFTMTDLEPGTDYYVYVRNACGTENSVWTRVYFRTPYVIRTFPYEESFSSTINTDLDVDFNRDGTRMGNWTRIDRNGDFGYWIARSGGYVGFLTGSYELPRDQFLVSPKVIMGEGVKEIEFEASSYLEDVDLSIVVSTDPTFPEGNYDVVWENKGFRTRNSYGTTFIGFYKDLSAYAGEEVYIAFRMQSETTWNYTGLYLRNVKISEVGNIPRPEDFRIEKVTEDTVTLAWTGNINATSYRVAYAQYLFNANSAPEGVVYKTVQAPKTSMEVKLPMGSPYYFYVQAIYPDGKSGWVGYVDTVVNCGTTPKDLPYIEPIDGWAFSGSNPIGCWYYYDTTYLSHYPVADTVDGVVIPKQVNVASGLGNYNATPWPAGQGLNISYGLTNPNTGYWENGGGRFLVSPAIRYPGTGMRMSFIAAPAQGSKVIYKIMVSITGPLPEDFSKASPFDVIEDSIETSMWTTKYYDIKDKGGYSDSVWVAIYLYPGGGSVEYNALKIDDIAFDASYNCEIVYDIEIEEQDPNLNTANLQVTAKSTADKVEVAYKNAAFNPRMGYEDARVVELTKNGDEHSGILTNMISGQLYYIYVRSSCGNNNTAWVGPFQAYGACATITEYPYTAPFDKIPSGETPTGNVCWETSGDYGAFRMINKYNSSTSSYQVYLRTAEDANLPAQSAMDEWLISPRFGIAKSSTVSFDYLTERYLDEKFEVRVSTTGKNKEDFNRVLGKIENFRGGINYPKGGAFVANLDEFISQDIYIAIVHLTENNADTVGRNTKAERKAQLYVGNFRVDTNTCAVVTNVTYDIDENDKATVSWDGSSQEGWIVRYSSNHFLPKATITGAEDVTVMSNTWTMSDAIAPTKQVRFYIKPICDSTVNTEVWYGPYFIQNIRPINTFPFVEDFENWDIAPVYNGGWTILDGDKDEHTIVSSDSRKTYGYYYEYAGLNNSKGALYEQNGNNNDFETEWNDWMISPQFDFSVPGTESKRNPVMDYWTKIYGSSVNIAGQKWYIYIGDELDTTRMVVIDSLIYTEASQSNTTAWASKQVYLKPYIDQYRLNEESIYIGLRDRGTPKQMSGSSKHIMFDDFRIRDVGSCVPPSDVEIVSVGSSTARILWNDDADILGKGDDRGYRVMYAVGKFDPLKGSSSSKIDTTRDMDDFLGKAELNLTGLTSGATHYLYISPMCDGLEDLWYGPYSFKTDCDPIESFPYDEDFSWGVGTTTANKCWNSVDANNDGLIWSCAGNPQTGDEFARFYATSLWDNVDTINDWLISPAIVLPKDPQVGFTYSIGTNPETFDVLVGRRSKVRNADNTFVLDSFVVLNSYAGSSIADEKVVFTDVSGYGAFDNTYVNDTVYFAFHINSIPNRTPDGPVIANMLSVTQFQVTSLDACSLQPRHLRMVGTADANSVNLTWEAQEGQTQWIIDYVKNGTLEVVSTGIITETSYLLTGLEQKSTYTMQVKAVCGASNDVYSLHSDPITVSTSASCPAPVNVNISKLNGLTTEIEVAFTGGESFIVNWERRGSGNVFGPRTILENVIDTIDGLTAATWYDIKVKKVCRISEDKLDTSSENTFVVQTRAECFAPTNLAVSTITQTGATVTWDNMGTSVVEYEIEYEGAEGIKNATTRNNYLILTNLTPGQEYTVKVRVKCGADYYSDYSEETFETQPRNMYTVTLSVNIEGRGTAVVENPQAEYEEGTSIIIVATSSEATRYRFVNWTNTIDGTELTTDYRYPFVVTQDTALTANFIEICNIPTDTYVERQYEDTTILSWVGTASEYEVMYKQKLQGEDAWVRDTVESNSIKLLGLERNMTYVWKVRALCAEEVSLHTEHREFDIWPLTPPESISEVTKSVINVRVTPNPVKTPGIVTVEVEGVKGKISWTLLDANGRILNRGEEKNASEFQINTGNISAGTYLIRLMGERWEATKLIIVQ